MDYTTILTSLENSISGVGGIIVVAVATVLVMVFGHVKRMNSHSSRRDRDYKNYQNTVIAPYTEESEASAEDAMSPHFSRPTT